jgi:hypothetical protein
LLNAQLSKLPAQRTEALGLLLTDPELLAGKLSDALRHVLELLPLLAVDVGQLGAHLAILPRLLHLQVGKVLSDARLLSCQRALLRCKVAVLLSGLLVDVGGGLAKLSLIDAQLSEALARRNLLLREVAVQPGSGLAQLSLLRGLLPKGLANVGQLPR